MVIVVSSVPLASVICKVMLYVPAVLNVTVCGPCVLAEAGVPPLNVQFQADMFVPVELSVKVILSPSQMDVAEGVKEAKGWEQLFTVMVI